MKRTKFYKYDVYLSDDLIYSTDDYSIFQKWPGNRPINQSKVNPIKKSILQVGWFPSGIILLGPNCYIGDGQHRIEALRQIEKETGKKYNIKYQVDENLTLEHVILMNSTNTNWNPNAHLQSQAELARPEYIRLLSFIEKYKFPVYTAAVLARGISNSSTNFQNKFKKGLFRVEDWDMAYMRAENILSIRKYFDKAFTNHFIKAMLCFWNHPDFNDDIFMHKLELNRNMLYPCSTVNQYKQLIANLYNYKNQNKINFIV